MLHENTSAVLSYLNTGSSDRLLEKVQRWKAEAFVSQHCAVRSPFGALSLLLFGRFGSPQDLAS